MTESAYEAPELVELGSIRNVTQANTLQNGQDGCFSFPTSNGGNGGNGGNPGHHGS